MYGSDCCNMSLSYDEGLTLEKSSLETFYGGQFSLSILLSGFLLEHDNVYSSANRILAEVRHKKKYGKSSLSNLSRPGEVFVINAHGTPTKKKICEGNYSLKSLSQAL